MAWRVGKSCCHYEEVPEHTRFLPLNFYRSILQIVLQRPVLDRSHLVCRAPIVASKGLAGFGMVKRQTQRSMVFDRDLQFEVMQAAGNIGLPVRVGFRTAVAFCQREVQAEVAHPGVVSRTR